MWISIFVPLFFVTGIIADVSHLTDEVKLEKVPVPLFSNEFPVPSVEPLEVPKENEIPKDKEVQVDVVTATSIDVSTEEVVAPVQEDVPPKSHLPILLPVPAGRSLNLGEVDPGFSRPIITNFPSFPLSGRSLVQNPIFLPYFNQQYQQRYVVLPANDYLPPAQQILVNNELQNEYLPPDNEYLPPQARHQITNKLPNESDKLLKEEPKEEEVVTETPVLLETTEEIKETVTEVNEYKDEASDSVIVTKQGTAEEDEVVVVHQQKVPEKIEIIPSSGYFYPRPRVLFLYRK